MKKIALFLAVFFAARCAALALEPGTFVSDGKRDRQQIALTFDDGPGEYTKQILDVLDRYQVKATFFMNGDQVEIRPDIARDVLKRGHEIADHTHSHINFYAYMKKNGLEATQGKIRSEIKKSKEMIEKTVGGEVRICRMPHGFHKPWMKDIAKEFGYTLVNWTFGEDWLNVPQEKMAADYVKSVKPGAILLFHDGGRNRGKTVAVVPQVIEEAKRRNLSVVTVGELLR